MNTGHVLLFIIVPTCLEGFCEKHHAQMSSGVQQNATHCHYRAVEGEVFMPCINSGHPHEAVAWSRIEDDEKETVGKYSNLTLLRVETKHSGNYSCVTGGFFHLQVVKNTSLRCFDPKENSATLVTAQGGHIPCPGRNCSDNTNVVWYKGNKLVSEMGRYQKQGETLYLDSFREHDNAVFFCDRLITERGITWIFRRSVQVTVITKIFEPPWITYPEHNMTEEVELGRNHTLTCEVNVPFEKQSEPQVEWYVNYNGSMVKMEQQKQTRKKVKSNVLKVTQKTVIRDVTLLDLDYTYTCVAKNNVGSVNATIKLKKKITVRWQSFVEYAVVSLLLVAGLGFFLRVKWVELQLIYRSRWQHGKRNGADKEFDVFLSYVMEGTQMEGGAIPSYLPSSGSEHLKKTTVHPSVMEPLKTEDTTRRPIDALLRQVLEDEWGYRLCLLDRDVLPGGAFTNEVAHALQHSQMLICLLSADYLCNNNTVFVLESGVQALLQKHNLKLLLIWTRRDSTSLIQLDPPLPTLVQRALKVLPTLDWTLGKPSRTTGNFWRSLRKFMPSHKVQSVKGDFYCGTDEPSREPFTVL